MKCPECGAENSDNATFCELCYKKFETPDSSSPPSKYKDNSKGAPKEAPPAKEEPEPAHEKESTAVEKEPEETPEEESPSDEEQPGETPES